MDFEKDNKKDDNHSIANAENLSKVVGQSIQPPPLQLKTGEEEDNKTLPYQDSLESTFGSHDMTGVSSHTGSEASSSAESVGANSYAIGNNVAFDSSPSANTVAHEAAHIVHSGDHSKKEEDK